MHSVAHWEMTPPHTVQVILCLEESDRSRIFLFSFYFILFEVLFSMISCCHASFYGSVVL